MVPRTDSVDVVTERLTSAWTGSDLNSAEKLTSRQYQSKPECRDAEGDSGS